MVAMSHDSRESALALLRSQHDFPGHFEFRVVVRPDARSAVLSAIAAVEGCAVDRVKERWSRNRNYVSLAVRTELDQAEHVLDVYEVVGRLQGVMTTL